MVVGTGLDIVEVARVRKACESQRFVDRVFTASEVEYCRRTGASGARFAARFAAKEAVMKALGCGWGPVGWRDIEVVKSEAGGPAVRLYGPARELAASLGVASVLISLSHTREYAAAVATALDSRE